MKNQIGKFLLFVIVFFAIHFLVTNSSDLLALADKTVSHNIVYELDDFEMEDYSTAEGGYLTGRDPKLVLAKLDTTVKTLKLEFETEPQIPYVQIFYTNETTQYFGECQQLKENETNSITFQVNDKVNDLRIDLGDEENVMVKDILITINPVQLQLSFSILLTIIIVYWGFQFLGSLQKQPKFFEEE